VQPRLREKSNHRWVHLAARHAARRSAEPVSLLIGAHHWVHFAARHETRRLAELVSLLSAAHELL
jgi:hypothetical protein